MGDWGFQPWETDEAADWFHRFWNEGDIGFLIDEIKHFEPLSERYEQVRAAAYLLQTLGIPYIWRAEYSEELKPALSSAIAILENMIHPPSEDWEGFLDSWSGEEEITKNVEEQIAALKMRLMALA